MQCNAVRNALDAAFDSGEVAGEPIRFHLAQCPECAEYAGALENLDAVLRSAPAVAQDPALVARIQASIAAQPAPLFPARGHLWGMALAALIILAAAWRVAPASYGEQVTRYGAVAVNMLAPDWTALQGELLSVPVALMGGIQTMLQETGAAWGSGSTHLMQILGENGIWLWPVFALCLTAALSLNTLEVLSRLNKRRRH